ncbi:MAG: sulfite exporter TauE/SafE family protein [Patescibacteria group bacterium]|nr:sulfite exporter TauE/SafE family protein [Patescibacteria group bacterium]
MRKYKFHVSGIHCPSCKIFIEDTLNNKNGVSCTNVDLKNGTILVRTTIDIDRHKLAKILNDKINSRGYHISIEKQLLEKKDNKLIWQALPIGFSFLFIFYILQKSGILNFGFEGNVTPITSFIIGLIASVSSCMAVVGGLVLSLSATVAKDKISDIKPMLLFHSGRLMGFALLGGVLGSIGSLISVSFTLSATLGIIASIMMIILGFNLVGLFEKNIIALPSNFFTLFRKVEHETITTFLVGVGTFFLPCGFTQTMQFAAISSGSFLSGFLVMTAFALGTFPVLAFLSFGSVSFAQSKYASLFFKSAGVIVIGLGIFGLLGSLAVINPLFNI